MNIKHEITDVLDTCIDDRFRLTIRTGEKIPYSKLMNFDLLCKFGVMCINSIGRPTKGSLFFVDEVKNGSMIINLHNTMKICSEKFSVVDFRNLGTSGHIKTGRVIPLVKLASTCIASLFLFLATPFLGMKRANQISSLLLIRQMSSFISAWIRQGYSVAYVMTDHNFYSTIICNFQDIESNVLQHGLILDASYYHVYAADHFLAWGKHSEKLMNDPEHVRVTGTCKFSCISTSPNLPAKEKKVLYCVSSRNYEEVRKKTNDLKKLFNEQGYQFAVKLHPGSGFRAADLVAENSDVEFYKEELLQDIPFTLGIIENSTVLMDLMYLNKPYIIFDSSRGYFSEYPDVPLARSIDDLPEVISQAEKTDYKVLKNKIMEQELNSGCCEIFERTKN